MNEPPQAGHQTLRDKAASLWDKDGLDDVILAIADGAVQVERQIRSAAFEGNLGTTGEINVQGEVVQRLDTMGNDIFVDRLIATGNVVAIGSEEMTDATIADRDDASGFLVQMDPVDGSSNIDVAAGIGSVFGIWHNDAPGPFQESSLLRPGNEQVAAAYVIYGTSTILVAATRNTVQGFTLDNASGEFLLTHPDIRYPEKCKYYSANVGNFGDWGEPMQRAVTALQGQYTLRYIGSLVCDFHRNMLKGGIYLYPGDTTNVHGKLRLMYEANPLAYIAEQAGGAASTGAERILDVQPQRLHQQTPLIVGSQGVVEDTLSTIDRSQTIVNMWGVQRG